MALLSNITRDAVVEALEVFDSEFRPDEAWQGWQEKQSYKYAIQFQGKQYPVKTIVSLATGVPVSDFSGGKGSGQANEAVEQLGFEVVQLHGRNPPWSRDELILALDLYLRYRDSPPDKKSSEVEELSDTLNQLAQKTGLAGDQHFRNANGVYMKLMNFRALDPAYTSEGKVGLTVMSPPAHP